MSYANTKLGKYQVLMKNSELAFFLPETKIASSSHVQSMLEKYKVVFLKPSNGTGGVGIFRLNLTGGQYILRSGKESYVFTNFHDAFQAFKAQKGVKTYLVQRGISLLNHKQRPFDLRVMVQRNSQHQWEVTGILGRVASPRKIVTNCHNGGTATMLEVIFKPYMSAVKQQNYSEELNRLGLKISRHMSVYYPKFRSFGIDIGIDQDLRPWIIEVNTKPDKYIFRALKDKTMFRRIMNYAKLAKA